MDSLKNLENEIQTLEDKLSKLRDELDKKDNSPIESSRIRKEINDTINKLNNLKDKLPIDPESDRAKELFYLMRRAVDETVKYKNFFDL